MSEINTGDLVMVVKPQSCGCAHGVGSVFVVRGIATLYGDFACEHCRADCDGSEHAKCPDGWYEVRSLKKIPPPDENEIISQQDEVTA